jgi:hypothetical protein
MIAGVVDSRDALWYLFGDPSLSVPAKATFDTAASSCERFCCQLISLAEVVYHVREKPPSRVGLR